MRADLVDMSDRLGCELDFIEEVLGVLQGFEPVGVMARDVRECLTIQLKDRNRFDPAMAALLENLDLPGMKVLRAGNGGTQHMPRMLPHALLGEFGLSLLAASRRGAQSREVMVDFGYSREVLANNLGLLGIDPARIDAAVLSHGHLDHYGGFAGLFGAHPARSRHLPLTVGGEETFCERVAMVGDPPPVMGALDRVALARAGFDVRIDPAPRIIADHAFTTGVIPLDSFERAAIPTRMRPGIGCNRTLLDPAKRNQSELADDGEHELATCYAVKGLGLVVIASCSHRGGAWADEVEAADHGMDLVDPRHRLGAPQLDLARGFTLDGFGRRTLGHGAFQRLQFGQRVDFHGAIVPSFSTQRSGPLHSLDIQTTPDI
eukprot:gene3241-4416_t